MRVTASIVFGCFIISSPALSQNQKILNFDISPSWLIEEYGSAIAASGELIASERGGTGISKDGEFLFLCSKSSNKLVVGIKLNKKYDGIFNPANTPTTISFNDQGTERSLNLKVSISDGVADLYILHEKAGTVSGPNSYDEIASFMNAIAKQDLFKINAGELTINFKTMPGKVYSGFLSKIDAKYKVINHCYNLKPK